MFGLQGELLLGWRSEVAERARAERERLTRERQRAADAKLLGTVGLDEPPDDARRSSTTEAGGPDPS
jgi:probable rRNA maturation factor